MPIGGSDFFEDEATTELAAADDCEFVIGLVALDVGEPVAVVGVLLLTTLEIMLSTAELNAAVLVVLAV
jgi:hypothetical protein